MKRAVWAPVSGAEHDGDEGPAGEDVDGGELVHLAHALELADVEAVQADELARTPGGQAEPEGLVLCAASVTRPVVAAAMAAALARRWERRPRPWATSCFCTVDLAIENPWSPSRSAYWRQPMVGSSTARVSSASTTWVGVASGIWGARRSLGINAVEPVAVGHLLPLVVAGPRDAEDPAGLGHVARSGGMVQHGEAPLVDDLCWGHGDGLLGSLVGTTESIAGPLKGVDVQPQPWTGRTRRPAQGHWVAHAGSSG